MPALTVAVDVEEELHAPPLTVGVRVVVLPSHNTAVPESVPASIARLTVTTFVVASVLHIPVTV